MRSLTIGLFALLTLAGCSDGTDAPVAVADAGSIAVDTGTLPVDTGVETAAECTTARDTALKPVEKVSSGEVKTLESTADTKTLYVDASAGGSAMASSNPWIYLDLATGTRVDVNDKQSLSSTSWDLAIKRPVFRTNSGHGGAGAGGAVFLKDKSFDTVTDAEAWATLPKAEKWFNDSCELATDAAGAIKTTFDGWYLYDSATMKLTPAPGTWIVRGAKGALYRLEIATYYASPDGTVGATSARYKLRIAAVK